MDLERWFWNVQHKKKITKFKLGGQFKESCGALDSPAMLYVVCVALLYMFTDIQFFFLVVHSDISND